MSELGERDRFLLVSGTHLLLRQVLRCACVCSFESGEADSELARGIRFEMFDEPWKEQLNRPGREWEDKWGLMDIGRNLKPGVKIPDCGGKTVS